MVKKVKIAYTETPNETTLPDKYEIISIERKHRITNAGKIEYYFAIIYKEDI